MTAIYLLRRAKTLLLATSKLEKPVKLWLSHSRLSYAALTVISTDLFSSDEK